MESSKAQLRQQLLASENALPDQANVNTMSGFAANGRSQHPGMPLPMQFPNQPVNDQMGGAQNYANYSNHDLVTPVLEASYTGGSSSRKASMNSMSMQRLFRRKGNAGHFDEETGADSDLGGAAMSFSDITHLRGSGRYNTSAMSSMDTAPIIPVLGMPGSGGAKSLNNVQYRKFMNQQKKMSLAQGARAMSLAGGGNPVAAQDPRSMSFTNAPNSRNNSLGNPLNGMGAPNARAMSLNSNGAFRGQPNPGYGYAPGAPRPHPNMNGQFMQNFPGQPGPYKGPHMGRPGNQAGPMHQQMPMNGAGGPYHPGNHTMSSRTGAQPYRGNQGSRANSLSGNGMPMSFSQNGPYGPRTQSMTGPGMSPINQRVPMGLPTGGQHPNQGNYQQMPGNYPNQNNFQPNNPNQSVPGADLGRGSVIPMTETSTESLGNVLEEEEDDEKYRKRLDPKPSESSFKFGASANASLPLSPDSDDDHVYNFDDGSPQVSRKSTVTKSNSMRVRKLNLFNTPAPTEPEAASESPNLEDPLEGLDQPSKLRHSRSLFNISDTASNDDSDYSDLDNKRNIEASPLRSEPGEIMPMATNESHTSTESSQINKPLKFKSLTHNTAFSKFRTPSSSHAVESEELETENPESYSKEQEPENLNAGRSLDDYPDRSKESSESHSNYSSSSTEPPKHTDTNPTQASISSDQSRLRESKGGDNFTDRNITPDVQERDYDYAKKESHAPTTQSDSPSNAFSFSSPAVNRESSISRSNSELKMKGLVPSSALLRAGTSESNAPGQDLELDKREKRKSVSSISSKSRSLMKRLSFTNSKKAAMDDPDIEDSSASKRRVSSASQKTIQKPLTFTKEELAIMTCNNDLQSELQLVTSELAFSIKRELGLEARLRSKSGFHGSPDTGNLNSSEDLERSKIITDLQEKLNKERKLRFISEEHAILAEHGQSPSPLKLDYEKNEIYNQLLAKNEMVIQLQDKLDEALSARPNGPGNDLVTKFNELLRENAELKTRVGNREVGSQPGSEPANYPTDIESEGFYHECDQAHIMSLKTQRDELREMITKLTSSRSVELKIAQEKIKTLEAKLEKVNSINHKLSKRVDKSAHTNGGSRFSSGQGGKLQGFSIVSPSKKLFDE